MRHLINYQLPLTACILLLSLLSCTRKEHFTLVTDGTELTVEVVADSISVPFGMAFLPDGSMLVTDRPKGKMICIDKETGKEVFIENTPQALCQGDGGMLDVIVHPDFENNQLIYFSYSILKDSVSTMVVDRAKLTGNVLSERQRLFEALPYFKEPNHFGNRLVLKDGYLFITMGDRYFLRDSAQLVGNHLGKVLRIKEDGSIPEDNPFFQTKGALPEIWSYGHRNPQGLAIRPATNELWLHEHGPKGGDEVNRIEHGKNYGWPVICYGIDYDGTRIGEGITEKEGMEQPIYYYVPSIAPGGMDFYSSDVIPQWTGNLFIGGMALKHLNRLVIEDGKVVKEERLLTDKSWRVRSVRQGPEGYLYIGVDGGKILRIRP